MTRARRAFALLFGFLLEISSAPNPYVAGKGHDRRVRTARDQDPSVLLDPPDTANHVSFGDAMSLDASGSLLVVGACSSLTSADMISVAYVYERVRKKWTLTATLIPPNATENSGSDYEMCLPAKVSMAGSGSAMLVAYHYERNIHASDSMRLTHAVYLYQRDKKGRWVVEKEFSVPKPFEEGFFGSNVYLDYSGTTVLILSSNAKVYNKKRGAGFIFAKKNARWTFVKRLKDIETTEFGLSGALDAAGTTAAISGFYNSTQGSYLYGKIVIFRFKDGTWKRTKSLSSAYRAALPLSVTLDGPGKTLAFIDPAAGVCDIYTKQNRWNLFDRIRIPSANYSIPINDKLVQRRLSSVSLSETGSHLALGAMDRCEDCERSGFARVYRRGRNTWKLQQQVTSDTPESMHSFGAVVSINSRTLAVSEPYDFTLDGTPGKVYIYDEAYGITANKGNNLINALIYL